MTSGVYIRTEETKRKILHRRRNYETYVLAEV